MTTQTLNMAPCEAGEVSNHQRVQGTCKWFNGQRGFGFIKGTNGQDYFVHQTSIISEGWRNLEVNQEVEFEVIKDNERLRAINVTGPGGQHVRRVNSKTSKQTEEICFSFQKGNCSYGDTCKFSHKASIGPTSGIESYGLSGEMLSREVCNFWKNGTCHRGQTCKYSHPKDNQNLSTTTQKWGVCYDWQEGKCNHGRNCKYDHCPTEWKSGIIRTFTHQDGGDVFFPVWVTQSTSLLYCWM